MVFAIGRKEQEIRAVSAEFAAHLFGHFFVYRDHAGNNGSADGDCQKGDEHAKLSAEQRIGHHGQVHM